jgi:hypothetical protein
MAMFTERRDLTVKNEYSGMSDKELAEKLIELGQQALLEGPVIEHDGIGPADLRPAPPEPRQRPR